MEINLFAATTDALRGKLENRQSSSGHLPASLRGNSLLGCFTVSMLIGSALFTVGNFLYGRMEAAAMLLVVALVSGGILLWILSRLWVSGDPGDELSLPVEIEAVASV
ncbi:hypothetical protein IAD21_00854 [Abditibacteriota bacterium]|nr:hypothetical protein IAD21_00854 [Abditibacteriota bacterium]